MEAFINVFNNSARIIFVLNTTPIKMKSDKTTKSTSIVFQKLNVAIPFFLMGFASTTVIFTLMEKISTKKNETYQFRTPIDVNIYEIQRLKGFQNIQPVVSIGPQDESNKLQPLKNDLEQLVDSLKSTNNVSEVSIYVRNFKCGTWVSINDKVKYHPASLMKVPLMLTVLKKAESNPGMLEQKIVYKTQPGKTISNQHFQSPSIKEGEAYSIHDLIYYCIANSDNKATNALATNVESSRVVKMFEDIGLPRPDMENDNYTIDVKAFSGFMETIFNAGFLGPEYSEYAAEMLENCSFKEGFSKGIPEGTRIWHKFGEWARPGHTEVELHESGVVFIDGKAYLITVMTRGKDFDTLATVLQKIANLAIWRLTR